jgi:hypothetical protein
VTGLSAVAALDEAQSWMKFRERLKPEVRFQPLVDDETFDSGVIQHRGGDSARQQQRRDERARRHLSFDTSGKPVGVTHSL